MPKAAVSYRTITIKLDRTEQLDTLARECGRVYSKTISYIHKIHRKKGIWLKESQVQKIIKSDKLHSQTTQAVIQKYFASLKSYWENKKTNPEAKPPLRRSKYFCIPFKGSAIHLRNGNIELSCGKGNPPVVVSIPKGKVLPHPRMAEIVWDNGYYLRLVVTHETQTISPDGKAVAVDPGEIHPIAVFDGEKGTIYNGRSLRAQKQYREKVKSSFHSKLSRKKKGSHRKGKLLQFKRRRLKKINNRIKDTEHKITRHFVETCRTNSVSTVVYGDTTHIRRGTNYGKKTNQKIHQWAFSRIRFQVEYKLAEYGIRFIPKDERGTSHTCPACGSWVNPNSRKFSCKCGFQSHRDVLGAVNILSRYQGGIPVVAAMAPASGVRFNWHLCCSGATPRIPAL
ncbi:transposase [Dehalococcoidia bacterium]|nr:transposase [Dehalococcoidia bacterium]